MVLVLGLGMLGIAKGYPLGRVSDMGPGFVPIWTAIGLVMLGGAILVADLRPGAGLAVPAIHWRGLALISASVLAFAALIHPAGLVPAIFVAVALSKLADRTNRPLTILIYSVLTALAGWGLFLVLLELPIRAFWR